ncbi:hypothetical protein ACVWVY_008692 [Bradyrhizobium sp. URHC0002]
MNAAAIVDVLRHGYGDDLARLILNDGLSQAALTDAQLRLPRKNRDVKPITQASGSGDFIALRTLVHPRISNTFMIVPNRCTSLT